MKILSGIKYVCALSATALAALSATAQTEASITNFFTPTFRSLVGSESAFWSDSFTNAYGSANQAAVTAPGGSGLANARVRQTTLGAFIIGSPSGDIYSFSSTNTFVLDYSVTSPILYANGIGGVVFQAETVGTELDYTSVVLTYVTCAGTQTVSAVRNEIYRSTGDSPFGPTSDVVSEWQWPPLPAGVSSFSIIFNGADTSVALERVMFDVTPEPAAAGPFSLQGIPANLARWMYPYNLSPTNRGDASTFAAFGSLPNYDTRDGQYLLGWNTANAIPAGQGARNYLIGKASVTLTINADMYYTYDGTLRDYRTYFPTNDPRHIQAATTNCPVELYGAGFRGGFTNAYGAYTPYSALNYPQGGPYGAIPNGGDYTNRVAYAACFDTNGVLVDVSDNVGDDGTNEISSAFEVAPFAVGQTSDVAPGQLMPSGSQFTFDLNLNDPLIYGYVQQGLNQGNLSFIVSSLVNAQYMAPVPNWPDFYTIFSAVAYSNQYPLLTLQGTVVRPCQDIGGNGIPDDWEQFYFGTMGVSATNYSNYVMGANPTNAATYLKLTSIAHQTNTTELHFIAAPSRQYSIQWSTNLTAWQTVTNPVVGYCSAWLSKSVTNPVYPSPLYATWRDTGATNGPRFYRIGVR